MKNKAIIAVFAVSALVAGGVYLLGQNSGEIAENGEGARNTGFGAGQKAIIYKSPTCGCCVGYAEELEKRGFEVEVAMTEDMDAIKDKYGVTPDKQSCHTIAVGDYFIEGHVPMEAVEKLLKEKPSIDGIGLPRMPSGTPGMPGPKRAPYEVYQLKGGVFSEFLTI
ncbi:MAG: hypothetical protein GXP44_03340 [bacterium]|nr:hypothetical protein [bacterium]